uniref:Disintegrin and metalloproteinase protein n=1 Tax=Cotesia chilonis TaxID=89804 RepID=A0A1J0M5G2_9HYME|nr:disintegrin and metalloproteinase protein [Cotesia chilonis]
MYTWFHYGFFARFKGLISVVFIGLLLLLEVSARQSDQRNYGSSSRRPSTRIQSPQNNLIGPTYEVVPNNPSQERRFKNRRINFRRINSWINPKQGVLFNLDTPVYSVRNTNRAFQPDIQEYPNVFRHLISNLYEDIMNASVPEMITRNNYRASTNNVRRPVPPRFWRPRTYVPRATPYKRNERINIVSMTNNTFGRSSSSSQNPKLPIPSIIHPEVLVIVDYALYKKFHRSVWEVVTYLMGFWNGVDLRFRDFNYPHVRLSIVGILIAEDEKALSYIYRNREGVDAVNGIELINHKHSWLYEQKAKFPFTSYDLSITMTGLKTVMKGLAGIGSACHVDHNLRQAYRTGFVNDLGAYEAIMAAAHEVGHLLGMSHDNKTDGKCGTDHGYVMAPILKSKTTSWSWSPCSRSDFNIFLSTGDKICLYNKPRSHGVLPRLLPGKLVDADQQCKRAGFLHAVLNEKTCLKFECLMNYGNEEAYHISSEGAADGTACGNGKICLRGVCREEKFLN